MEFGFPEYTDSFLAGQDVLYTQFNEIEFYVEDTDQQYLYFNILKRVFPNLDFQKIFPLNGKANVTDAARANIGNKKKVYIVDLDFDFILGTMEQIDNLFYLKKYSIENHLVAKSSIYEVIRLKNPKLKNQDIDKKLNYKNLISMATHCLKKLACCFLVIQKHDLRHFYYGLNPSRDYDFSQNPPTFKKNFIPNYFDTIQVLLKNKDRRLTLNGQISSVIRHFANQTDALSNIPGKHILVFLNERLHSFGLINQLSVESFTYLLAKDFDSNELSYLRKSVNDYLS